MSKRQSAASSPAGSSTKKRAKTRHFWDESYALLLAAFHKKHGHLRVPFGSGLAPWVYYQRYKACELGKACQNKLKALGMDVDEGQGDWYKRKVNSQFVTSYLYLIEYREWTGHFNPPSSFEHEHYSYRMGNWVGTQRHRYRRGLMDDKRRKILDEIGFNWVREEETEQRRSWEQNMQALEAYHSEYGHSLVPLEYKADPVLAYWGYHQKPNYLELTRQQIERLVKVDLRFYFDEIEEAGRLEEAVKPAATKATTKGASPKRVLVFSGEESDVETEGEVATTEYGEEQPSEHGEEGSVRVPRGIAEGSFSETAQNWLEGAQETAEATAEEHFFEEQVSDYTSLDQGRMNYAAIYGFSATTPSTFASLPSPPVPLETPHVPFHDAIQLRTGSSDDRQWIGMYEELVRYVLMHGDTKVGKECGNLWEWVQTQRRLKRQNKLQSIRKALLDQIGFFHA